MTGGTTDGTGVCISFCVRQLVTIFAFTSTPTSKIHAILVHISIPLPGFQMNSSPIHTGLKEIFINWCFSCSLNTPHDILLVYLSWFGLREQRRCIIQETRIKAPKPITWVHFNDANSTEQKWNHNFQSLLRHRKVYWKSQNTDYWKSKPSATTIQQYTAPSLHLSRQKSSFEMV